MRGTMASSPIAAMRVERVAADAGFFDDALHQAEQRGDADRVKQRPFSGTSDRSARVLQRKRLSGPASYLIHLVGLVARSGHSRLFGAQRDFALFV